MSIQNEIDRIEIAKENIADALGNLGVTIPSGTSLSAFPNYISAIVLGMDPADYDADSAVKNAGGIAAYGNTNYEPKITAGVSTQYWRGDKTWATLNKSAVGLGNVDNVKQYSSSNPPPYPVTSVNGNTGAILLTASDVGALPSSTVIPAAPGELITNATTAQTASSGQSMSGNITLHKISKTGNYNDLLNKPTIPSAVTESTVSGWGFTKNTGTYIKPSNGIPSTDLANGAVTKVKIANNAVSTMYTATIPHLSSRWTKQGGFPFCTITVNGLLVSDNPIIDVLVDFENSNIIQAVEDWGLCLSASVYAGNTLAVVFSDIPSVDIPIKILCIRK